MIGSSLTASARVGQRQTLSDASLFQLLACVDKLGIALELPLVLTGLHHDGRLE